MRNLRKILAGIFLYPRCSTCGTRKQITCIGPDTYIVICPRCS